MNQSTQQIIDQTWNFADPAASEKRFRDAVDRASTTAEQCELRTQIARALGLQRRFDDAHTILNLIESNFAAHDNAGIPAKFAAAKVRCLLERGRVLNSSNQPEAALLLFEQSHRLAHSIHNDHLAVDAAHMIAIAHSNLGNADAALDWNRKALKFADKSTQPRARQWCGSLHNNIGWTLHGRGEFAAALAHFEAALTCRIEQDKPDDIRIARWCIARCLRSLKRIDEALAMQQSLLAESSPDQSDGYVHEELGELLHARGDRPAAAEHFRIAYEVLSQDAFLQQNEPARLESIKARSELRD